MADFIAVIRRAVDGLSENTPEMRVKVYERARGAVQRQLENMKPRPPEAMLQRQLDKLEAAIREVEGEHSEAVPVEEPIAVAPEPEVHEEPALEHEPAAETAPVAEAPDHESHEQEDAEHPVYEQPAEAEEVVQEAVPAEEAVPEHAEWHPPHEEETPAEEWRAPEQAEVHAEPERAHEPGEEYYPEEPRPDEVAAEPVAESAHEVEEELQREEDHQPIPRGIDRASNRLVEPMADFEPQSQPQTSDFIEHTREEPVAMDAAAHFDRMWSEPVAETPAPLPQEAETEWAREELHSFAEAAPAVPADASARAFDEVSTLANSASPVVMPAAKENFSWEAAAFDDLPPIEAGTGKKTPAAAHFDDVDIFAEVHAGNGSATPQPTAPGEGWREARALRGYDRPNAVTDDDDSNPPMDLDQIVASKLQGKNFRMEPKRRRFGIGTILAILVTLGVLGGGAYAGWMNREAVMEMVDGLVSSAPSQAVRDDPATSPAQQNSTPAASQPTDQSAARPPARPNQEVASLDGSAANAKFTQRLLADGTEVDNGPAAVPGTPTAEGKSVAEQNVAAADTSTPSVQSDAAPAENLTPNGPVAAPAAQNTPVGATEKMFLYEERIGESSPTAIEGSVVWTVQHEAGQGGRQEATVQGNVTVPERNLSALLTFKRNSDPSLPASHLVEIVFSVPPNFEGGSIDSVQRISMKRTEQDRGDPLIAVPAKITDDFHMIALNDYPDARKANLDLLATRDWIDVPITYRNGRRALLTMQKGATGGNAFGTAIKEWTALGDLSTSQ
ncbi:hypothetical protein FHT78_001232 [Rhizobium sp. BK196]|uniref:hypothetical protein n=1 Tax=unclassified Rhizobium TaxID=2613769 RepID=UPI00161DF244|nr:MULTISPECIES: hypothetical protein [unclassified Rhizobium]MBB3309503.1 hypothetical protein [Rhizobium sp. BK196]MBB3465165.1 hypothetical protein [Rhizobium sp. BK377]